MRWFVRLIREACESAPRETQPVFTLGHVGGLNVLGLEGAGGGGSGWGDGAMAAMSSQSGEDRPARGAGAGQAGAGQVRPGQAGAEPPAKGKNAGNSARSEPETEDFAHPSEDDGVPEDMATLVLDNPALGQGAPLNPAESHKPINYASDESRDAAALSRAAAGTQGGYNFLVGKYHRAMINFLFRMVHNQAVAEELAQEVFLRVYRSRESYRAEAKFTTWLYRIATNLAVNHARDTKHERSASTIYLDT